jgi:hypothetical protein
MRFSAPLYLFDQKDSSLKVVPLGTDPVLCRLLIPTLRDRLPKWGVALYRRDEPILFALSHQSSRLCATGSLPARAAPCALAYKATSGTYRVSASRCRAGSALSTVG